MFGIGSTELIVILLVALIVLGPKNLAGISRTMGRIMGEFRRVSTDFQRTLNAEAAADDLREKEEQRKKEVAASQAAQPAAAADASGRADVGINDSLQGARKPQAASAGDLGAQAGMNSQGLQEASTKPSGQAGFSEDGGMELAPPPDSPLARALAQTSAEAARAETVIAVASSQPDGPKAGGDGEMTASAVPAQADANAGGTQASVKTDATTGGKTGVGA